MNLGAFEVVKMIIGVHAPPGIWWEWWPVHFQTSNNAFNRYFSL